MNEIQELINAGADVLAFALDGSAFSTLPGLKLNEVEKAVEAVHTAGGEIQILMNRLFMQKEITDAQKALDCVMRAGADAAVFADPGLLNYGLKHGYASRMIYRSETMTTSAQDVQWYMHLHLKGVTVSPLLTEEEIKTIAESCGSCVMMAHGYLPESISRRPLVSAFAQSAGLGDLREKKNLHLRELKREGRMPLFETDFGTMIHNDYVQESFRFVRDFEKAGVTSFEINGEYLPFEAVKDAVSAYRLILNGASGEVIEAAYREKWQQLPLETGYYGQKTVR